MNGLVRHPGAAPLAAFAALGAFWGAWSAVLPGVSAAFGVSDAALGAALLCVGAGALPAMLLAGRLTNRLGARALAPAVAIFGLAAALPAFAGSIAVLAAMLLLIGAASGGLDVVMNAAAAEVEATHRLRLMHLAHAVFSASLFAAAVSAGIGRDAGIGYGPILIASAGVILALAAIAHAGRPPGRPVSGPTTDRAPAGAAGMPWPLVGLGGLCALAYLVENGLELWSALHLERSLGASPTVGGLGPGTLALAAVGGRLAGQAVATRAGDGALLMGAAIAAAAGAAVFALAPSWSAALAGLALAGAGISIASPTIFSLAGRTATPERRGSAVSLVAILGYLGFLTGPALLGAVSSLFGLRTAILAIAGCALLLAFLVPLLFARLGAGRPSRGSLGRPGGRPV
ncbi:MAG TPA: MFS transporter [Alphaproteobacteria bacterium]|nr:MFS transporter [Alphaproteobacteria bacterium]